jgi:hypothetical protein
MCGTTGAFGGRFGYGTSTCVFIYYSFHSCNNCNEAGWRDNTAHSNNNHNCQHKSFWYWLSLVIICIFWVMLVLPWHKSLWVLLDVAEGCHCPCLPAVLFVVDIKWPLSVISLRLQGIMEMVSMHQRQPRFAFRSNWSSRHCTLLFHIEGAQVCLSACIAYAHMKPCRHFDHQ